MSVIGILLIPVFMFWWQSSCWWPVSL